jgi:hypothetical protein
MKIGKLNDRGAFKKSHLANLMENRRINLQHKNDLNISETTLFVFHIVHFY